METGSITRMSPAAEVALPAKIDHKSLNPFFLAMSRFRRRKYDDAIDSCSQILERNPRDLAAWYVKTRALTSKAWLDDLEIDELGVADLLMDQNAIATAPRPGTSLQRPGTQQQGGGGGINQGVRPITSSGRPVTGFARPGTNRPTTSSQGRDALKTAMQGMRPGTSRPMTSAGRFVRLGTASMQASGSAEFIRPEALDLKKYAERQPLAKALCDYMLYVLRQPRKALDLCSEAVAATEFGDWWWKERLGKCYFQLGLYRDAEKQLASAAKDGNALCCLLELARVYLRLDQPQKAQEVYARGQDAFPADMCVLLGAARVHEELGDQAAAAALHKRVLKVDAVNAEALASLAANHFYEDQPEVAIRFYRRLLQMGVVSAELWNNLGLSCFYAAQYDLALACFDRALLLGDDASLPDIWYNVGQLAVGVGDMGLAFQAFKIALSIDPNHAESWTNLGVLELRKGNVEQAQGHFREAGRLAPHVYECHYNAALLAMRLGEFQEAHELVHKALAAYPEHSDSKELLKQLKEHFYSL